jgi:hypothetical protein
MRRRHDPGEADMSTATTINLTMQEVYKVLCPRCRKRLKSLVKDKLTDKMVGQVLGEGTP